VVLKGEAEYGIEGKKEEDGPSGSSEREKSPGAVSKGEVGRRAQSFFLTPKWSRWRRIFFGGAKASLVTGDQRGVFRGGNGNRTTRENRLPPIHKKKRDVNHKTKRTEPSLATHWCIG